MGGFDDTDFVEGLVEDNSLDLAVLFEKFLETVEHLGFDLAGEFEAEDAGELLFILTLCFIHGKREFFIINQNYIYKPNNLKILQLLQSKPTSFNL